MIERQKAVTVKGNSKTLIGPELKVGDKAPNFTVVKGLDVTKSLTDYQGKIKVIISTPSLDTGVCDALTRRFNEEAAKFHGNIVVLTISMDLPFAQTRFCTTAGIEKVETLSDHRDAGFGQAYGVLIKEIRLLNRAAFILDENDIIRYKEVQTEMSSPLNYEAALNALKTLV